MQIHAPKQIKVPSGPLTVREVVDLYLCHETKELAEKSARAFKERKRVLDLFLDSLGSKLSADCCPGDLAFWIDAHPGWRSPWTRLRVYRTINAAFNAVARLGKCHNPFGGVKYRKGKRGRPITPEEFQLLLRNTDPCFRRVLVFFIWSGARPEELRDLEWSFIDLEHESAVLWRHKTISTREDGAPRKIILHPVLIKLLIWIRRHQPHTRYVFLNSKGRHWTRSAIDLRLYRLRNRLGIEPSCKLYGCRHAWATELAMNGTDVATLAELLGHTSWQMAQTYVHVAGQKKHLHDAVSTLWKRERPAR